MQDDAAPVETPESFLANLAGTLRNKEGIDVDLADIVHKHILTTSPAKDAVALAKAAIVKLADERAAPPKAEAVNG